VSARAGLKLLNGSETSVNAPRDHEQSPQGSDRAEEAVPLVTGTIQISKPSGSSILTGRRKKK
jgi:hypothetical protein